MMEWTNDLIFEFLTLYENEPALWNSSSPQHKNKNDVHGAWLRIKTHLKNGTIPIKELKKKKENLMSTYRKLKAKIKDSTKTGSGSDDIYKPEWPFYDIIAKFLDDVYKPKMTKTTIMPQDENEMLPSATIHAKEEPIKHEKDKETNSYEIDKNNILLSSVHKKRTHLNSKAEVAQIKINESVDTLNNLLKAQDSDECDLYAKILAKRLKRYPEDMRQIIMYKIDGLLLSNPYPSERPRSASSSLSYQAQSPNNYCSNSYDKDSQNPLQTRTQLKRPIKSEKHRTNVLSQDITLPGTLVKVVGTAFLNTMEDDNTDDSV